MRVLTLSNKKLIEASQTLLAHIQKEHPDIDMLLGIATGGIYVSQAMYQQLKQTQWKGYYSEIKLSRPSTEKKESLGVKKILTKLPYFLSNLLRILEVKYFEFRKTDAYDKTIENRIHFSSEQREHIIKAKTLLLIDDAIDTGSTMLALKNTIEAINPNVKVITAVLTVTHKKPYVTPDFTLYNHVLLRCPWAMDYKGGDNLA